MKNLPLLKGTSICTCFHFHVDDETYKKIVENYKTTLPEWSGNHSENDSLIEKKLLEYMIFPRIRRDLDDEKIGIELIFQIRAAKERFDRLMSDLNSFNALKSNVKHRDFIKQLRKIQKSLHEKASIFLQIKWEMNSDENENLLYEYENKKETPFEDYRKISETWLKYREKFFGDCCAELVLDAKAVKLLGGLKIPKKLILPNIVTNKFGKSTLAGIKIKFEETPLGIESIAIEGDDNQVILGIEKSFGTDSPQNVLGEVYRTVIEIGKIMTEMT